jgi:hypothetical protein
MQQALTAMLDQVRGSRQVFAHLAALESALGDSGVAAIDQIAPSHLSKIHTQLRVLPIAADDAVLQELVERVQRALQRAASRETHRLSPFDPEATVVITEGSHTDFMDALDEPPERRGDTAR